MSWILQGIADGTRLLYRQSVKLIGKNSAQGLVNGGLLDAVKGRLIILRQTPTFAPLNSFLAFFD